MAQKLQIRSAIILTSRNPRVLNICKICNRIHKLFINTNLYLSAILGSFQYVNGNYICNYIKTNNADYMADIQYPQHNSYFIFGYQNTVKLRYNVFLRPINNYQRYRTANMSWEMITIQLILEILSNLTTCEHSYNKLKKGVGISKLNFCLTYCRC